MRKYLFIIFLLLAATIHADTINDENYGLGYISANYLKLDQSTPQTVTASPIWTTLTSTYLPYINVTKQLVNSNMTTDGTNFTTTGTLGVGATTLSGNLILGANTITTSNATVVTNLNSDLLDGYHATGLSGLIDHGTTTGLSDDDHTQYALLVGRSGGQTLIGDTASGGNLTLQSTSHATKGKILFGTSAYDEVNNRLGIGTTGPTTELQIVSESSVKPVFTLTNYYEAAATAGQFSMERARGTSASPAALVNGDRMGVFKARGYAAGLAAFADSAYIFFNADGNEGSQRIPGRVSFWTSDGTAGAVERLTIKSTGNVGIGTTDPGALLEVSKTGAVGLTEVLRLSAGTDTGTPANVDGPAISFRPINSEATWVMSKIGTIQQAGSYAGDIVFQTNNDVNGSTLTEKMRIMGVSGNVGIATTDLDGTPAIGRLTVKGSTNDGTTNILVGRDSDEANVFSVNTNGQVNTTAIYNGSNLNIQAGNIQLIGYPDVCVGQYNYDNENFKIFGQITAITDERYVGFQVSDVDDYFHLTREDVNILGFKIDMPVTLGSASTDVITCTGRLVPRTVGANPTVSATAGTLGEIVFYNDKWYGKTVASGTDTNWSPLN